MLELTKQERSELCEAIALRLLELEGYTVSGELSKFWRQNPRYKVAVGKADQILRLVTDFSRDREVEDGEPE